MTDLIKEIIPWLLVVVGIIWLTGWLTNMWLARLDKKDMPEEKDVIGKVLPVGSKFLKDGRVVEVISSKGKYYCSKCIYKNIMCLDSNVPICLSKNHDVYFKYVKR